MKLHLRVVLAELTHQSCAAWGAREHKEPIWKPFKSRSFDLLFQESWTKSQQLAILHCPKWSKWFPSLSNVPTRMCKHDVWRNNQAYLGIKSRQSDVDNKLPDFHISDRDRWHPLRGCGVLSGAYPNSHPWYNVSLALNNNVLTGWCTLIASRPKQILG